jgi:hypothetical protein
MDPWKQGKRHRCHRPRGSMHYRTLCTGTTQSGSRWRNSSLRPPHSSPCTVSRVQGTPRRRRHSLLLRRIQREATRGTLRGRARLPGTAYSMTWRWFVFCHRMHRNKRLDKFKQTCLHDAPEPKAQKKEVGSEALVQAPVDGSVYRPVAAQSCA